MTEFKIKAGDTLVAPFDSPLTGAPSVRVVANGPVKVYMLDAPSRSRYVEGADFNAIVTSPQSQQHSIVAPFQLPTPWFLAIENASTDREVTGSFSVAVPSGPTGAQGAQGGSVPTGMAGPPGLFPWFPQ
jgi:hypothetical protein